jgi:thiol-disulfide isomerase/thioredoxin
LKFKITLPSNKTLDIDIWLKSSFMQKRVFLLFFLVVYFITNAQNESTDLVEIGKPSPDFVLENIINYSTSKASLKDFNGKWLLLDFWGPYCIPCVEAIPKMEQLQRKFENRLQIMMVGLGSESTIKEFYNKREMQNKKILLPSAIDTTLHKLFKVTGIPHYVWINDKGVIWAITYETEIDEKNIEKFLKDTSSYLPVKGETKVPYDFSQPFLVNKNGGTGSALTYHSVLTGYTDGLNGTTYISNRPLTKITAFNSSIAGLYRIAYADSNGRLPQVRVAVEIKDQYPIDYNRNYNYGIWKLQNAYCYELIVPDKSSKNIFKMMQQDLDRLFGLDAHMEKRTLNCLVLVKKGKAKYDAMNEKPDQKWDVNGIMIKNKPMSEFADMLQYYHQDRVLLNETGYKGNVSATLNVNMLDLVEIKKELSKYGLDLIQAERKIDVLVLRDPKKK